MDTHTLLCKHCGENFSWHTKSKKYCPDCVNIRKFEANKRWAERNKELLSQVKKEWEEKNPDRRAQSRVSQRRKNKVVNQSDVYELMKELYPENEVIQDDKAALKPLLGGKPFEIDVFIPELGIGVDIKGKVHFEPIYGEEALIKIQFRDRMKELLYQHYGLEILDLDVHNNRYDIETDLDLLFKTLLQTKSYYDEIEESEFEEVDECQGEAGDHSV